MRKIKIIVKSESANFWWGIYGFCEKIGWEDLNLFHEDGTKIGRFCLNGKAYLRTGIEDLGDDPEELEFVTAVEKYLADNKCHYWYYYADKESEVSYLAPLNEKGLKPNFTDVWHPDERIGISTIETAVKAFVKKHLVIDNCEVEIQDGESFEESYKSFKEEQDLRGEGSKVRIEFADDVVEELSRKWKLSTEEVLKKLKKTIQ